MSTALYLGIGGILLLIIIVSVMMMGKKDDKEENKTDDSTSATAEESIVVPELETNLKFILSSQRSTPPNDDGKGDAAYLDRHYIKCGNDGINAINGFNLTRPSNDKIQYNYSCSSSPVLKNITPNNTAWESEGPEAVKDIRYLDRHNVDCGNNKVITDFTLVRDGNGKYRYSYNCADAGNPLTCRNVSTQQQTDGGGTLWYLDRHNVKCNSDEVLSQFLLTRPTQNEIKYDYKCCKY